MMVVMFFPSRSVYRRLAEEDTGKPDRLLLRLIPIPDDVQGPPVRRQRDRAAERVDVLVEVDHRAVRAGALGVQQLAADMPDAPQVELVQAGDDEHEQVDRTEERRVGNGTRLRSSS